MASEQQVVDAFYREDKERALALLSTVRVHPGTIRDGANRTLLHWASLNNWPDVCKLLVDKYQVDPHCRNSYVGWTALHLACNSNSHEVVRYLVQYGCSDPLLKSNIGVTPLDYSSGETREFLQEIIDASSKQGFSDVPSYLKHKKAAEAMSEDALKIVKEVSGEMNIGRVLLHGGPRVGKTSVKRLILNQEPLRQDSTKLVEDPVRAVSTGRLVCATNEESDLQELNEDKIIKMVQKHICDIVARGKNQTELSPTVTDDYLQTTAENAADQHLLDLSHQVQHIEASDGQETTQLCLDDSQVLKDIASNLNMIDPDAVSSLYNCHHVHLIDSGGQPQFSNSVPLVLQSQCHHHIVVTRLDQKLDEKPQNWFAKDGVEEDCKESLTLTNYELIERVCQLAKCSGSQSKVIVIGTRFDEENKSEPVKKKNEILVDRGLLENYSSNLMHQGTGKNREIIFAVNAVVEVGDKRTNDSRFLQKLILGAPILTSPVSGEMHGASMIMANKKAAKGIPVPIRWMVFEMELSRRSKKDGIIDVGEIKEITQSLQIKDPSEPLLLFKALALCYYYPTVLPNIIFTSIAPISMGLSKIVEATLPCSGPNTVDENVEELRNTGTFTKDYLVEIAPDSLKKSKKFSINEFLELMIFLRIIFALPANQYFMPSLLPLKALPFDDDHSQPLLLYWLDEKKKIRIMPQSFYHALIVELLNLKEDTVTKHSEQSRLAFVFDFKLPEGKKLIIQLIDEVFWLKIFADCSIAPEDCQTILDTIQSCSKAVLQRLQLSDRLGYMSYGVACDCSKLHPSEKTDPSKNFLKCLVAKKPRTWEEKNKQKLLWLEGLSGRSSSNFSQVTHEDLYQLLKDQSSQWNDIGRVLKVSYNHRENLLTNVGLNNDSRLENVLYTWLQKSRSVTWVELRDIMETNGYVNVAEQIDLRLNKSIII